MYNVAQLPDTPPIYVESIPATTAEAQLVEAEIRRNFFKLRMVEAEFLNEVFDEDNEASYEDLLAKYQAKHETLVERMHKQRRFKRTSPVKNYFYAKYNIEKPPKSKNILSPINDIIYKLIPRL